MLNQRNKIINKVSFNTIIMNALLSLFKFISGIVAHSNAMISDSIHSLSDVFSTIVVIIGAHFASKEADDQHPYGHERFESVAAIILAGLLIITGLGIGSNALAVIISGNYQNLVVPGLLGLIAAIVSIIVKEIMYWYTRYFALKISSQALMADAWHHRSDALSSVGSLIGIIFARLSFPIMDLIASLIICFFIILTGIKIFIEAIEGMIDKSIDNKTIKEIKDFLNLNHDIKCINEFKSRIFGNRIYVEIEVCLDSKISLKDAYIITQKIHFDLENKFKKIKHVSIIAIPSE